MKRSDQPKTFTAALAITGVSLMLGILFDVMFWHQMPGLSFPLYVAAVMGGFFVLRAALRQPVAKAVLWLLVPLAFFSIMVAVHTSDLLTLLNLGATVALMLLIAAVSFGPKLTSYGVGQYLRVPLLVLKFSPPLGKTLAELVALPRAAKNQPTTVQVLKGIALTVPFLVIFVLLFSSADLVVHRYLTSLFNFSITPQTLVRVVLVGIATLGLIGAYSYTLIRSGKTEEAPAPAPKSRVLGPIESSILFGSLNVLFFAFIVIQFAYLFGGQHNISAQGFTYAEYARKGFFELIAVALLTFGLAWAGDQFVAKGKAGHTRAFRLLSGALVLQVILIMASAFKRLYLYEQAYGFTTLRLYSHAFTVLLAVIFLILLYKILKDASEPIFALPAFIAVIAFVVAMNLLSPDAFIARANLDRFHSTGKIDSAYLARLSDDALPQLIAAFEATSRDDKQTLGEELYRRSEVEAPAPHWQSWNSSRDQARNLLQDKAAELKPYGLPQP
ncbi:MAG TPA: DUF4173 domain-containing protein [Candidatus Saccharimonadia bacterium]|jgi:hypothetical protein|nr:DUF4173 domain-containing protein [Candidatus Saccharimonadia bacterium]